MESFIEIPRESITCCICYDLLENPYQCNSCNNLFCETCIKEYINTKEKYRRIYFCPMCRNKKNNFCENSKINDIIEDIKKSAKRKCPKCKSIIDKKIFKSHINTCWHKCKLCHLLYSSEEKFLEHFSQNSECKLDMILSKFNRKSNLNKSNTQISENDYGKIKREKFENNLPHKDEDKESNNSIVIVDKNKYDKNYDLFFCGKDNGINCKCCVSHICGPEGELCKECMKNNLKFHSLKQYYLINKKGRACKYTHGSFHCYSKFQGIKIDKGGNYFKEEKICNDKFTCEACKNITELMLHYLPSNVIKKLLERDLQSSRTRKNRK
jgi:hypothetical protein